jgi:hypothetical protein
MNSIVAVADRYRRIGAITGKHCVIVAVPEGDGVVAAGAATDGYRVIVAVAEL